MQSWRKRQKQIAFFLKSVSFNCNIEDLSALDVPLIDSVNWKPVAANNSYFFLSARLPVNPWISQAEKDPKEGTPTHDTCFSVFEENAMNRIKHN